MMEYLPNLETWKARVLDYDPDGDSKGECDCRKIRDEVALAGKVHPSCATCGGPVEKGTYTRKETAIVEGKMTTIYHCELCCDAMARWPESDDLERRMNL